MVPASFFVPGRVFLWMLPLWDMLQDEQISFSMCVPGTLQITVSILCVYELFACFLSKSSAVPSSLCLSQAYWPLELQALSSTDCHNSQNPSLLASQANCYGDFFLCVLPHGNLSLTLLCNHSSLPATASMILLSPKPHLCTSYLLQCGLFFTFSCGVCSASLQVISSGFRMIW